MKDRRKLDVREIGAPVEGQPQVSDRRMFFQLHAFTDCNDPEVLLPALSGLDCVLYKDLHHPDGVGIVIATENPADMVGKVRETFSKDCFHRLTHRPEMTMTGRTYASGRETDLEDWLIEKPLRNLLSTDYPWAIWYPLRRKPNFYLMEHRQRGPILAEHGMLGQSYASQGLAADIRLACFGLDANDNEFIIGIVGPELHPLSRLIQDMRGTQQTAEYIDSLGPFFVGHVFWRSGESSS